MDSTLSLEKLVNDESLGSKLILQFVIINVRRESCFGRTAHSGTNVLGPTDMRRTGLSLLLPPHVAATSLSQASLL